MDRQKNAAPTDFDLLNQLNPLSFLSPVALHELAMRTQFGKLQKAARLSFLKKSSRQVSISC